MKIQFFIFTAIILTFILFDSFPQSLKWEDRLNGDNSVSGLQSRGWVILDEDGGGTGSPWFQGNPAVFTSFDGPDTGYVASNFEGANLSDVVDQWLISPALNVSAGDSLSFFARSPSTSTFDDSINILVSVTADTTPSAFMNLGRFLVPKTGWSGFYITFVSNATIRFAIRYYLFDAQTNSDFIGLDLFQLYTQSSTYPSTISINKSFTFGDASQSSSYRMIGLPGNTNFGIPAAGTRKTDWNAFYDNGAATNYLVEWDGSANFNFKPGNGFWILSKNNINVNQVVNSVTLAGDNTYSIQLHNGWNIISNPFERSTQWSAVQNANGLAGNSVIYDWSGNWTNPASFAPYKAYYFNNVGALTSLKIPYDPSGILGKTTANNQLNFLNETDVKITLMQGEVEKSKVIIGFNSSSNNDFDNEDYFAPPGDFEDARVVVRNENLSTDYKMLMKDSRSEIGEGQIYNLEVKNSTGKNLSLSITGTINFDNYLFCMIDERLNNEIKLSENLEISIGANVQHNNYKLLIGTQQFIDANKGNFAPTNFELFQNYPNPFNPATTLRYSVPKQSKIIIKLFDMLGKELKTLLEEVKSPGNYELQFDASGLASGVYFYQLQTDSFKQSKKMVVLK